MNIRDNLTCYNNIEYDACSLLRDHTYIDLPIRNYFKHDMLVGDFTHYDDNFNVWEISDHETFIKYICSLIEITYPERHIIAHYKCILANFFATIWRNGAIRKKIISKYEHKLNNHNIRFMTEKILIENIKYIESCLLSDIFDFDVDMETYWDIDWYNRLLSRLFVKGSYMNIEYIDIEDTLINTELSAYDRNNTNGYRNGANPTFLMNWRELNKIHTEVNLTLSSMGYIDGCFADSEPDIIDGLLEDDE